MTVRISVYIAASLDGFIARKNGDLDWLPAGEQDGEDFGYADFMSTIDHVVMGRNTFEKVLTFRRMALRYLFAHNPAEGNNIIKMLEKEAKDYMKAEVSKLQDEGIKVTGVTRDGAAPDTILEVAEETNADVIAMSTHGRSGVQRWLMGSVAEKVVHTAHIPVMLIHPN